MKDVARQMSTITDGASCPNTSNMSMQPQNHLIPESQANFNAQSQPNLLLESQSKSKSLSQTQYRTNSELNEQNILQAGNNSRIGSKLPVSKKSKPSMEKKGRGTAKLPYKWGSETKNNTTLYLKAKSAVLHQLNDMWRDWKQRLKANYFTPYKDHLHHNFFERPNEQVELDQWLILVEYWKQNELQKQAKKNAESRAKKKYPHRTGKTPIPHLKEKMRYEGVHTTEFDMFIASRSCGQGIDVDPKTANLVVSV
ncbi:hypothetical protein BUALT_Bualt04G0096100 [Buddleja alternifolia]|uniref:Uncharacterized protein n=1 Tax=Buddleja alternifolia TaxID=168488 RepID=A0AAV6XP11_9LAMI|nr:hypothetical protein BUALT_Bualt04G0096100 [Buddleja alternifolia]